MSSKQGDSANKINIKRLCIYGLLCGLCIIIGFIESLINLSFIAPGIKIGLSNTVALCLAASGDTKGAFAVNIGRIVLSSILFGTPASFAFSLAGGIMSLVVISIFIKIKTLSLLGVSAAGGAVHNIFQILVAAVVFGRAVFWYLPVLIVVGTLTGALVGFFSAVILKKIETKRFL